MAWTARAWVVGLAALAGAACSDEVRRGGVDGAGPGGDAAIHDAGPDGGPVRPPDTGPLPDVESRWACMEGTYRGTFAGTVSAAGGTFPTEGDVSLTLEQVGSGEFLEVGDGTISGVADGQYPYQGRIEGTLDCGTRRLDARIVDASVTVLVLTYNFEGTLTADYVVYDYLFENGVWDATQTAGGPPTDGRGDGTWSASLE